MENTYDVFMNELSMEDEPFARINENANVQIERNINSKNNEDKMIFKKKITCTKTILKTK
jgi:hypothetical protein